MTAMSSGPRCASEAVLNIRNAAAEEGTPAAAMEVDAKSNIESPGGECDVYKTDVRP